MKRKLSPTAQWLKDNDPDWGKDKKDRQSTNVAKCLHYKTSMDTKCRDACVLSSEDQLGSILQAVSLFPPKLHQYMLEELGFELPGKPLTRLQRFRARAKAREALASIGANDYEKACRTVAMLLGKPLPIPKVKPDMLHRQVHDMLEAMGVWRAWGGPVMLRNPSYKPSPGLSPFTPLSKEVPSEYRIPLASSDDRLEVLVDKLLVALYAPQAPEYNATRRQCLNHAFRAVQQEAIQDRLSLRLGQTIGPRYFGPKPQDKPETQHNATADDIRFYRSSRNWARTTEDSPLKTAKQRLILILKVSLAGKPDKVKPDSLLNKHGYTRQVWRWDRPFIGPACLSKQGISNMMTRLIKALLAARISRKPNHDKA